MSKHQNPFSDFGVQKVCAMEEADDSEAKFRAKRLLTLLSEIVKKIAELIMKIFIMIPFNFLQGIFHPELLAERNIKQREANRAAAAEDMESAMERSIQRRLQARRQPAPAPQVKTESEIVAAALKDVSDICPLNAAELCRLAPDWFAWLDNLTPQEAREALKHPVEEILRHLRGETILPGVRAILTDDEREELKAIMAKEPSRYRYDPLPPISAVPEVQDPDGLAFGM